ncbi:hypothetical protein HanIR_Chr15g0745521 [Helianthus annuus]|nr:hypothetical protein HanIR_Chr15g0745521 [Helianthus annuus]
MVALKPMTGRVLTFELSEIPGYIFVKGYYICVDILPSTLMHFYAIFLNFYL